MKIRYEKSAVKYLKGLQSSHLAMELVKRLVLAWDPDFTKLTPDERVHLESVEDGEYIDSEDIDWNN